MRRAAWNICDRPPSHGVKKLKTPLHQEANSSPYQAPVLLLQSSHEYADSIRAAFERALGGDVLFGQRCGSVAQAHLPRELPWASYQSRGATSIAPRRCPATGPRQRTVAM